jgi:hypothetical protein
MTPALGSRSSSLLRSRDETSSARRVPRLHGSGSSVPPSFGQGFGSVSGARQLRPETALPRVLARLIAGSAPAAARAVPGRGTRPGRGHRSGCCGCGSQPAGRTRPGWRSRAIREGRQCCLRAEAARQGCVGQRCRPQGARGGGGGGGKGVVPLLVELRSLRTLPPRSGRWPGRVGGGASSRPIRRGR